MRTIPSAMLSAALAASLAACGDDGDGGDEVGVLDCAWVQGEDNCFEQMLATSTACLPESSVEGTLDATGTTCTLDGGATVTFGAPLDPATACDEYDWDLRVTGPGGTPCLELAETDTSLDIVTSTGMLRVEEVGAVYRVTCPDGRAYEAANPLSLLECLEGLPATAAACGGGSVSFALGVGESAKHVFNCSAPLE